MAACVFRVAGLLRDLEVTLDVISYIFAAADPIESCPPMRLGSPAPSRRPVRDISRDRDSPTSKLVEMEYQIEHVSFPRLGQFLTGAPPSGKSPPRSVLRVFRGALENVCCVLLFRQCHKKSSLFVLNAV